MIPPWGNLFIELLEIDRAGFADHHLAIWPSRPSSMNQTTMQTIAIFTLALLIYLAISLCITIGMRGLEQAVDARHGARASGR